MDKEKKKAEGYISDMSPNTECPVLGAYHLGDGFEFLFFRGEKIQKPNGSNCRSVSGLPQIWDRPGVITLHHAHAVNRSCSFKLHYLT